MADTIHSQSASIRAGLQRNLASAFGGMAPALGARNFRLFWLGQLISTIGTSVQVVAEGWLIYDLTGSTFWLGMVGLLGLLPVVPISFVGGLLIDRVPRRKLIIMTQVILLGQAAIFGLLGLAGQLQLWHIILLYFVFGAALAIDHPARRAFLVELVDRKDLANAVALNATLFNISSLVGYALAGLLIAAVGAGTTMLINAATYLAPIYVLMLIRVTDVAADGQKPGDQTSDGPEKKFQVALMEGIVTLWRQPAILGTISLMAVVGGLAFPVFGMMPAYAEEVVQTGAVGLGLLMAAGALGSLLGSGIVAKVGTAQRGRTLTLAAIGLPLLMLGFATTHSVAIACCFLIAIGTALLIVQSLAITLVQVHIPDRVRGRVMSLYSLLHAGSDTMGNVAVGWLGVYVGLPIALGVAAAGGLLYALGVRLWWPAVDQLD